MAPIAALQRRLVIDQRVGQLSADKRLEELFLTMITPFDTAYLLRLQSAGGAIRARS